MSYSSDKPFKDREHILWEIGYCNKAANYVILLSLICLLLGIISNLLAMKLALDSTSWFMVSIVAGILSLLPTLHELLAKHLLGMEVIKKDQK
jgi:uncharacterized membrane protein